MMRKKAVQNLDERANLMLENAFYACNPPDTEASVRKQRPPLQMYLRKLIYFNLSSGSVGDVSKALRKMRWGDVEVEWMQKLFTRVWKVKYSNLHLLAF